MVAAVVTQTQTPEEEALRAFGFEYEARELALDTINLDSSAFNHRLTRLDEDLSIQYGIAMENGAQFPPIVVHTESGITGYVIDSGVHRVHGRVQTSFKKITAFVLKGLDLKNPETVSKLDELRVHLNLGHGRGLDQAERKLIACNWVAAGSKTIEDAANFFDLDIRALREAYHNFELDVDLRRYGLNPSNFARLTDKESVLRKGLTQEDMRNVERLIVRYSSSDAGRKVTSDQIKKVTRELSEVRTPAEKIRIMESLRAELATTRKRVSSTGKPLGQASNPTFRLRGAISNVEVLDVDTLLSQLSTSEIAVQTYQDVKSAIDRLAALENRIAAKWSLPTIQVLP